jgi:hypothetical protein
MNDALEIIYMNDALEIIYTVANSMLRYSAGSDKSKSCALSPTPAPSVSSKAEPRQQHDWILKSLQKTSPSSCGP